MAERRRIPLATCEVLRAFEALAAERASLPRSLAGDASEWSSLLDVSSLLAAEQGEVASRVRAALDAGWLVEHARWNGCFRLTVAGKGEVEALDV